MPIVNDSSSPTGKSIPLQKTDVERLLKGNNSQAVAYKAYQLDPGFRKAFDHYASQGIDQQTMKRLPELMLNRYYFGTWEREPVDELTATMSQGAQDPQEPGFLGRIGGTMKNSFQKVLQRTEEFHQGQRGLVDTLLPNAANLFSAAVSPATEAIGTGVGFALNKTGASDLISKAAGTETGQKIINTATDIYGKVKAAAPQELETLGAVGKAALDASEVVGAGQVVKATGKLAKTTAKKGAQAVRSGKEAVAKRFGKDFDEAVAEGFAKGIKPQFRGAMRNSPTALKDYNKRAGEAVKQILDRQSTFQYIDDAGDVVSQGTAPTNLSEFAQAIQQAKRQIFDEYSALTTQATGQGMAVDLDDIVEKLIQYADDPVKQAADPSKTQYALKMAERLSKQRRFDPKQTEQLIKELNESLAPTYADKAAKGISEVDLSVANALREKLDDVVIQATGKDYQALKNSYGALKAIEKDVGHRALVVARQNTKGVADLTDIFTGGDLVAGIFTANPAFIARGAAGFGIKELYKKLVSPDANIMRLFRRAGRSLRSSVDDAARLTPEEQVTGLIGGSDLASPIDDLDDVPLSQLDPQGVEDAAQAEDILQHGGSLDDALHTADDNIPPFKK